MKKLLTAITLVIPLVCGCTLEEFNPMTWALDPELDFSESGHVFSRTDVDYELIVTTNYNEFEINCPDSWCSFTINGQSVNIHVEPNLSTDQRSTYLTVSVSRGAKSLSKEFSIVQLGGYWDVAGSMPVFWNSLVSDSQKEVINNLISNLVFVKGATFYMGSQSESVSEPNYVPTQSNNDVHSVTLSDYYICKYELTQREWNAVMGTNPSRFQSPEHPVEHISWEQGIEFCKTLSSLTGLEFTLPTEAQWEYAARGGQYSFSYLFSGSDDYEDVAHFIETSSENSPLYHTVDVGTLEPNELDIYDMSGNVAEMCLDWYGDYVYGDAPLVNPSGPSSGTDHVERGGAFNDAYFEGYVFMRTPFFQTLSSTYTGMRIVLNAQ